LREGGSGFSQRGMTGPRVARGSHSCYHRGAQRATQRRPRTASRAPPPPLTRGLEAEGDALKLVVPAGGVAVHHCQRHRLARHARRELQVHVGVAPHEGVVPELSGAAAARQLRPLEIALVALLVAARAVERSRVVCHDLEHDDHARTSRRRLAERHRKGDRRGAAAGGLAHEGRARGHRHHGLCRRAAEVARQQGEARRQQQAAAARRHGGARSRRGCRGGVKRGGACQCAACRLPGVPWAMHAMPCMPCMPR
jgi:hypothetical protein